MCVIRLLAIYLIIICSNLYAEEKKIDSINETLLYDKCSSCHSLKIVHQQRLSKARWEEIILLMYKEHGMIELTKLEYNNIIEYLSEYYNE